MHEDWRTLPRIKVLTKSDEVNDRQLDSVDQQQV